jgi:hypothetical protein
MRRRPLLGAAVLVGASRAAARHEVVRQDQISIEAQRQADAAHQRQMQEEAARDQKTQLAIQAALEKERSRSKSPIPHINENQQSGHPRGAVAGYCATCGAQCIATDRFCVSCGTMYPQLNTAGSAPPQYLETGPQNNDSKDLLT